MNIRLLKILLFTAVFALLAFVMSIVGIEMYKVSHVETNDAMIVEPSHKTIKLPLL